MFTVYYTDGTSVKYSTSGAWNSLAAVDCPGTLTYSRSDTSGAVFYYFYFYTEGAVTTEEFYFSHMN